MISDLRFQKLKSEIELVWRTAGRETPENEKPPVPFAREQEAAKD